MENIIIEDTLLGVSAPVFNSEGKILMLHRNKKDERFKTGWEFIKGGVKEGESFSQAAYREIIEEAGYISVQFIAELDKEYVVDVSYREKKYKKVKKRTCVYYFNGGIVSIPLNEHDDYKWMDISNAIKVCWVEYSEEIIEMSYRAFLKWKLPPPQIS